MTHIVYDILTRKQILGCLIFKDTSLGFFNGFLRKNTMVIKSGNGAFGDNIIDLFLIIILKIPEGFYRFSDQRIDLFCNCIIFLFFFHILSLS